MRHQSRETEQISHFFSTTRRHLVSTQRPVDFLETQEDESFQTTEYQESLHDISILVNAEGGWDGNALEAASARGHKKVVQLLLEKGAYSNAQGGEYGNALHAASVL